jgi:hypothetical protein
MTALLRMAGSVSALGAALIALAVGAAPSALAAVPWLALPLVAAGIGQGAVAVLALRGRALPAVAVLGPLALPTVAWVAALAALPAAAAVLPLGPMLGESALALGAAALLAHRRPPSLDEPRALPGLLSIAASATIVAAVATAALAGTDAGRYAVPHGEHDGHGASITDSSVQQGDDGETPVLDESLLEHHGHH